MFFIKNVWVKGSCAGDDVIKQKPAHQMPIHVVWSRQATTKNLILHPFIETINKKLRFYKNWISY